MATEDVQGNGMPVVYVFRKFTHVAHSPAAVSAIKKIEMLTPGGMRLGVRWGTKVTAEFALGERGVLPGLLAPLGWALRGEVADVLHHDLAALQYSLEH